MILKNCAKDQLLNKINGKRLICFGAGRILRRLCAELNVFDQVEFVSDNNSSLYGEKFEYGGKSKPIMPIESCFGPRAGEYVVFITCGAYFEVFEQLNRLRELEKTECYIFHLLSGSQKGLAPDIPKPGASVERIPRKIHYMWVGGGKLPELDRKCVESWKKHCPDYEIIRWDEHNYDISKNTYMKQAYEAKKWGFVPDFARLDIVYEHGGIYLDTDVEMLRSFNPFLAHEGFAGFQFNGQVALGLGFGAVAGNEVVLKMREAYNEPSFFNSDETFNMMPSPVHQTETLKNLGLVCDGGMQDIRGFKIYPSEVFCPKDFRTHGLDITENTFSIHHFNVSWYNEKQKAAYKEKTDRLKYLWSLVVE